MTGATDAAVTPDLVEAAVRAAERLGKDVADVPVVAIAREAGISRSTLLRRLGGTRHALDDAVRATGVDPGGQSPVRERAIEAGAVLISGQGLAGLTLEAVAAVAQCSVHSLYVTFGGRDELLHAIFDRYSPALDLEEAIAEADGDLARAVHGFYRVLAATFTREPRIVPAIIAQSLALQTDEGIVEMARYLGPRLFGGLDGWLRGEVDAGRLRDFPTSLLIHQMTGPLLHYFLFRPVGEHIPGLRLADLDQACTVFAESFLRSFALPGD
ncbi:TetR family transcriptional regulator [Actinocorallia herbida]|uniref:TetR family transcriptional regulator n=1 Tax=Actinocorallia herbida TaxID=58109 RepID=A0A3N1CZS8_9ACTN|nr:TetR/AcrR family transcriptional regulator [Actinocorallia herbida]ROO86787.1 TetR family transcriptional regulator [Actinocorallia herbida]